MGVRRGREPCNPTIKIVYLSPVPPLEQRFGLSMRQHIFVGLKGKDGGEMVQRMYTLMSLQNAKGLTEFLVKCVF